MEPPDPIPNSEVKRIYADDSVGIPHAKVGHRQVFIMKSDISVAFSPYGHIQHRQHSVHIKLYRIERHLKYDYLKITYYKDIISA